MARAPISLVENQNPQVSEGELMAEIEIEAPGTLDMSGVASDIDIEMDDDGGAMVDFDPMVSMPSLRVSMTIGRRHGRPRHGCGSQ